MKELVIYSMVVASVSYTISEAAIFRKMRVRICFRNKFFGKLISCGYCLGFWLSFLVIVFFHPVVPLSHTIFDWLFSWLILSWLAGFEWVIMCWLMKVSGK